VSEVVARHPKPSPPDPALRLSTVAQISGTVTRGETAAGVILTGKQYAFTITLGDTQRFSLPRFAATIDPCSGGSPKTVAVTQGHYTTR